MGGLHFGNLAKIRGIVYFRLSPYEQKAFGGVIDHGVPNIIRRMREQVLRVVPRKLKTKRIKINLSGLKEFFFYKLENFLLAPSD